MIRCVLCIFNQCSLLCLCCPRLVFGLVICFGPVFVLDQCLFWTSVCFGPVFVYFSLVFEPVWIFLGHCFILNLLLLLFVVLEEVGFLSSVFCPSVFGSVCLRGVTGLLFIWMC